MAIRIYHTADNHIGLTFNQYAESARKRLVDERFAALERMVTEANKRKTHFFVVAGDLFDKQTVAVRDINRTVKILSGFEGEAVLVLAGNHDHYEEAGNKLWKAFAKAAEGTSIYALTQPRTVEFEVGDERVRFYACPCPSKHGAEPMTGWVADEEKEDGVLHIGIAHGNVEGFGLDENHRYFNMTERGLKNAGVHTWLLGHIHVPAPEPGTVGLPTFFMAGTHTPDSVKCTHPGHAWYMELDVDGRCRHEQCITGGIRFMRIKRRLLETGDIECLQADCAALNPTNCVLDLQLEGRLGEEPMRGLRTWLKSLGDTFLHATIELEVTELLSPETVAKQFPEGTLQHSVLSWLLADEDHPGDAQIALDIINQIQ